MGEIITPIERLVSEPSGDVSYLINEKHTIADIARWIIKENWTDDLLYCIKENSDD